MTAETLYLPLPENGIKCTPCDVGVEPVYPRLYAFRLVLITVRPEWTTPVILSGIKLSAELRTFLSIPLVVWVDQYFQLTHTRSP